MKNNTYTCIDIGSYEIKLLVCNFREDRLFVLTQKTVNSMGIERGQITNFDKLVSQIKKIKDLAEADLKQTLKNLIITMSPTAAMLESVIGRINLDIKSQIESANIRQLFHQVMEQPHSETHLPVGLVPRCFKIDENQIVQNPRGLFGMNLGIEAQRILMPTTVITNIVHAVEAADFTVDEIIVGSISEALLSLETPEMYARTCHINVGHSLTTITVINDGRVLYARSQFNGGRDITRAISERFNISEQLADELKINYGKVILDESEALDAQVIYIDNSTETGSYITRGMLNDVITEQTVELFKRVKDHIVNDLRLREQEYHYVLTGGTAELPNILHALKSQLPMIATIYRPSMLGIRNSKFSSIVSVGIFGHELNLLLDLKNEEQDPDFIIDMHAQPSVNITADPDALMLNLKQIEKMAQPSNDMKLRADSQVESVEKNDFKDHEIEETNDEIAAEVANEDEYMDQKLGNSGMLVRFLDKIFNENDEES